jgi:hypothetical protein
MQEIKDSILKAALAVCENAAFLPDGNAQVPEDIAKALGDAFVDLAQQEQDQFGKNFAQNQIGLNSAQVSIQRAFMDEDSLKLEQTIDAADRLYLSIFDEVIVPGKVYRIKSTGADIRYLSQSSIKEFLGKYEEYVSIQKRN